jgi:hypothetical protein
VEPLEPGAIKFYPCDEAALVVFNYGHQATPVLRGKFVRFWQTIVFGVIHFHEVFVHAVVLN